MNGRRIGKLKDGKGNVYPILRMPKEWADLIGKQVSMERTILGGKEAIILYVAEPSAQSVQSSVQSRRSLSLGRGGAGEDVGNVGPIESQITFRRHSHSIEGVWRRGRDLNPGGQTPTDSPGPRLPWLGYPGAKRRRIMR